MTVWPLFRFEILAVLANELRLVCGKFVEAADLAGETLITYPVPELRIDVMRDVLSPANIHLKRRTAELTIAILQLVASRRGIAALPNWGLRKYIENDYVIGKRIGKEGLWSELHAVMPKSESTAAVCGGIHRDSARAVRGAAGWNYAALTNGFRRNPSIGRHFQAFMLRNARQC